MERGEEKMNRIVDRGNIRGGLQGDPGGLNATPRDQVSMSQGVMKLQILRNHTSDNQDGRNNQRERRKSQFAIQAELDSKLEIYL